MSRKEGQHTQEELQKRNLRDELEERERKHYSSKDKSYAEERDRRKSTSLLLEGSRREAEDKIVPREIDADDSDVEPRSDDESDEDDDDDDDTEALMAELERIKKERAEENLRKERQQAEEEAKMKEAELMRGNPLIKLTTPDPSMLREGGMMMLYSRTRLVERPRHRNVSSTTLSEVISTVSFCKGT